MPALRTKIAIEQAGILVRRGGSGDRELARQLPKPALETSRSLELVAIEGRARTILSELEREGPLTEVASAAPVAGEGCFRREGDYWVIEFGGIIRLRDAKGLGYLAVLLANPGREFHSLDLAARLEPGRESSTSAAEATAVGLYPEGTPPGGLGIDQEARAAYGARLVELRAELDEAESFNDPERAERAREEMEMITAELAAAFGLGGRARPAGSAAERARQSVTKAIRDALRRIEVEDPKLGAHLGHSVRTGLYCAYDPDPAAGPRWKT